MNNRTASDSAIPSVTETLREQAREQRDKAAGVQTAASLRTARMIAAQDRNR